MPRRVKWTVKVLEAHLSGFDKQLEDCGAKGLTLTVCLYGLTMRVASIVQRIIHERYPCYYKLEEFHGDLQVVFYPKAKRLDPQAVRRELGREEVAHARSCGAAFHEFSTQGVRRASSDRE